jgi:hypothetical protein
MNLRCLRPVVAFERSIYRLAIPCLAILLLCPAVSAADPIEVFRTGDELVIKLDRFDLLRQANSGLTAALKLGGDGQGADAELSIDLSDAAVTGTLVIDLSKFGRCAGLTLTVKDGSGKPVAEKAVAPIPDVPVQSRFPASPDGPFAYIEPGKGMNAAAGPPRIQLPDPKTLRPVHIDPAKRSIAKRAITFPVTTDVEAPARGNVVVGRQTAAPKDPAKASLYVSYKKAIYEGGKLDRWQKFLMEVPVQRAWGNGTGDETVTLAANEFEVHVTNEVGAPDWRGISHSILGDDDADLGQTAAATDDDGRIYWMASNGLVRFDPNTRKFERAPGDLTNSLQKLCPGGDVMKGSPGWLSNGIYFVCARGRIFLTVIGDSLSPPTGSDTPARRVGGVFSVPQDWRDAAAFAADVRLHVGSWETAKPALYKAPPPVGADVRKLGATLVTEAGLLITPAGGKYKEAGGPWRLDLDENGNNKAFGEVNGLTDAVSRDGRTKFPPTREVTVNGVSKSMVLHVGTVWGRHLVGTSNGGELTIPRASIRQILMSDGWNDSMLLAKESRHAFRTYAGAPEGVVTVKYDIVAKLKSAPEAAGTLATAMKGGSSLGPCFLVTPIPGEADKAVAVCEYATYPLSTFDFSSLEATKSAFKTALPARNAVTTKLGPYDSIWVRQGDEQWLYVTGYTGMTRIKYAKGGRVLDAMTAESIQPRLNPQPVDQVARGGLKQYDRIFPVFGGRLMDSGTGRSGRGGTAFTTGLELFDPALLGTGPSGESVPSQTAAYMSRCCGALLTLQSRIVWDARDGSRRQEIFGTGKPNKVFVDELEAGDKALAPTNLDAKLFSYEVREKGGLRDLFGFSLPKTDNDGGVDATLALSPCHRFLLILSGDGVIYTYSIGTMQFVDGIRLTTPAGDAVAPNGFRRPGQTMIAAPDGQLFFLAAPADKDGVSVQFNRIVVDKTGAVGIEPHLEIKCADSTDWQDLTNCVRCFMPDLKRKDGSVDLVIGWDSKDREQAKPFVRVIADFIPPADGK